MPRVRSLRVAEVKAALAARLRGDWSSPGGKFFSTRALAAHFRISFKTANTLLVELRDEGLLERRAASGTYLAGGGHTVDGVQLIFHDRAKRSESFGGHLLAQVEGALSSRGIRVVRSWANGERIPTLRRDLFPIAWECRDAVTAAARARRFSLCLNDAPPPGIGGGFVDAISTDDFSGGACAAELLKARTGRTRGFAVLGGPKDDPRSQKRIAGFCAHVTDAWVVSADSWFVEGGRKRAGEILDRNPAGVFGCNDRLAQAVLEIGREAECTLPPIIGFDNAPIAQQLELTTIGIPWDALVSHAVDLVIDRLNGATGPARHVTLAHELVHRLTA